MLTNDFKSAVQSGNLRRVKIMMKDSLLVDRTFEEFDDMVRYAAQCGLDIWDTEEDVFSAVSSDRSVETMNRELVNLIECFSKERVMYLKRLIRDIYGVPLPTAQQKSQRNVTQHNAQPSNRWAQSNYTSQVRDERRTMYEKIKANHLKIEQIFTEIRRNKKWSVQKDISRIEQYSEEMVQLCKKLMKGVK